MWFCHAALGSFFVCAAPSAATALPTTTSPAPVAQASAVPDGLTIVAKTRPRPANVPPPIVVADPTVGPDPPIPFVIITRVLRRNSLEVLRGCYQEVLRVTPALSGMLMVEFVIGNNGAVRSAEVLRSLSPDLDVCVIAQVKKATFPVPRGGPVSIRYPFTFISER
jgi:TonB family protein